jgi:hypothetical protein
MTSHLHKLKGRQESPKCNSCVINRLLLETEEIYLCIANSLPDRPSVSRERRVTIGPTPVGFRLPPSFQCPEHEYRQDDVHREQPLSRKMAKNLQSFGEG